MQNYKSKIKIFIILVSGLFIGHSAFAMNSVVFNEIAWMGTEASSYGEWIELYNPTNQSVVLDDWGVYSVGVDNKEVLIAKLKGRIESNDYYLMKRTTESSPDPITDVAGDYSGKFGDSLGNDGGRLVLKNISGEVIDDINFNSGWPAGCAKVDKYEKLAECKSGASYRTMEKDASGWHTNSGVEKNGKDAKGNFINGTPKKSNSWVSVIQNNTTESTATSSVSVATSTTSTSATSSDSITLPLKNTSLSNNISANAGDNVVVLVGDEVSFDGSQSKGSGLSFVWNFGDGSTKEGKSVSHVYNFPGKYLVTLDISDGLNSSQDQIQVDVYSRDIYISEFLSNPIKQEEEWVEIQNNGNYFIDLSEWGIGNSKDKVDYKFPKNTFIASNGFFVLSKSISHISFSNSDGQVVLFYPNGQIADLVEYKNAKQGVSAVRKSASEFVWSENKTPGGANVFAGSSFSKTSLKDKPNQVSLNNKRIGNMISAVNSVAVDNSNKGIRSLIGSVAMASVIDESLSESADKIKGDYDATDGLALTSNLSFSIVMQYIALFGLILIVSLAIFLPIRKYLKR